MLTGLKNTVIIAVLGLLLGIVIGTLIAAVRVAPKYNRLPRVLNKICDVYVAAFRGTPIVVQLLVFYYVLFPLMNARITGMQVSILVFGLNSGAYVSEIMRSGIQSVDPGQMEAGRSLGMNYADTMRFVIIPQAVKAILPALGNEFIVLLKDTSLISVIGGKELLYAARSVASRNYEPMYPYVGAAIIYLLLVMLFTWLLGIFERRLRASDRR